MLRTWVAMAGVLVLFSGTVLAQPDPSPPEMRDDAELAAVAFLDADRGWAVGDRGVIWHTSDGGRTWGQQNSGVTCRLEAVQFLDANNGWAVGGWTQPYTHETRGVVLRTRDGGRTWQNISTLVLPGLKSVRFFDARQGWALGDGSPLFPTGVFRTDDGGRTWLPVPNGETLGWVTGDFRDMRGGAVAGLGGTLGIVGTGEVRVSRPAGFGPRYLRRMQLVGQAGGWLVGDGGLVATTSDAGVTWQPPAGALPELAVDIDFRALAVVGPRIWMAGAPGTCVLHSADGGRSWQIQPTEQTAPLSALFFLDENRGWAVGALGTILQTRDGGQTWRPSRSGGKRAAVLGVFSEPQRVPLELLAQASGSDAYLSAVEIVGRRDLEPAAAPGEFSMQRRTHEAVLAAGGSAADTAWRFPIFERGLCLTQAAIVARWNLLSDGQALAKLEEHLVGRIRQWQPEVIVTEDVSPRGEDPLAHLTNQATLAAVAKAADPKQYPRQVAAGLAAWTVKKVFTVQTYERQSLVNITPAQWSPQLGRSLADIAESGRRLLLDDVTPSPRTIGLGLLIDHLPQETGRRDIMSGIVLGPGGEARRKLSQPPPGDLAQLSALARKRHNVEQLLSRVDSGNASADHWLGQIDNLTQGLPERHCGEILWQLARQYQRAGKGDSAAEALELLLHRYPAHPLADSAALWLVRYYTSSETAWRNRRQTSYNVQLVSATSQRQDAGQAVVPTRDEDGAPLEIIDRSQRAELSRTGQRQTAAPGLAPAQRAGRALAVANALERTRPTLLAAPTMQFPLSVARRQAGPGERGRNAPKEATLGITGTMPAGPWSDCVAAEGWIESGRGEAPKRVLSVVTAAEKPKLDGRLDDPLWQSAKSVRLMPAANQTGPPSTAVLAFDDEFLYFAVSCQKMDGVDYSATEEPRPHDSDLFRQDRVTLQLDVDRDYATWWELSIDHRGRPATSCFGDATWNPTWYIAAGGDDSWWTVEAAIPLAELAPKKPAVRDVWAVQIQRAVPARGVEALSHPAAIEPRPEGFGLLVFE